MANSAVFSDVEGTLLAGDTFKLYLEKGQEVGVYSRPLIFSVKLVTLITSLLPRKVQRVIQFYILAWLAKGREVEKIKLIARNMADTMLARCKPATLAKLREHQAQGRRLILISAMLHEVVGALAEKLEARGEGTRLKIVDGKFLNKLDGEICQKEGKADRARLVLQENGIDPQSSFAFGDTAGDIPYLKLFAFATVVDPDQKLEDEAKRRGWTILKTNL
jgi:HAD superfamily hydrolase (TIGR01490 family)